MQRSNHPLVILFFTCFMAFTHGLLFMTLFQLTLPETDLAHGAPLFRDPMVLIIGIPLSGLTALVAFPFVYSFLRNADLRKSNYVMFSVVLAEILIVTPFLGILAWPGAFLAMIGGLIFCKKRYPLNPAGSVLQ